MTAPGLEGPTVSRWVLERLTSDAALSVLADDGNPLEERVWEGVAPEDVTDPWWITFTVIEPRDVKGVGMTQVWSVVPLQVKVTGPTSTYLPLVPVYQRVHACLEAQRNQPVDTGGLILTCHRVSGIQYPERTQGVEYRHLGALFEAQVQ